MKLSLKNQYTVLQVLYWMSVCILSNFAGVYLENKGISFSWVGIIVGTSAFLALLVQPFIVQLAEKVCFLSVRRMTLLLMLSIAFVFGVLTLVRLPVTVIKICYMFMYTMSLCVPGLMNAMAMEYLNQGKYVDFGFSRGMGSFACACGGLILGSVIGWFSPNWFGFFYIGLVLLFWVIWAQMESLDGDKSDSEVQMKSKEGILRFVLKRPRFLCLMVGFFLVNINQAVFTYMINIVRELMGTEKILGLTLFLASGSELPIMILFGWLVKRTRNQTILIASAFSAFIKPLMLLGSAVPILWFLGQILQGISYGLYMPASVYFINEIMEPENRVKGQMLFYTVTAGVAAGIGNFMGGWLIDHYGVSGMLIVFSVLAGIGFLCVVIGLYDKNKKKGCVNYGIL